MRRITDDATYGIETDQTCAIESESSLQLEQPTNRCVDALFFIPTGLNARDDSGNPLQYNAPARSRRKLAESESTAALAGDQSLSCRPATVKRSRIL